VAVRNLIDQPTAAPSRKGGSCWFWSRFRR
jgi:hypothetical protein